MRLAVFLDVDNTLTVGFIQRTFAALLGVEAEYCAIEDNFQRQSIGSTEFGKQICKLFASQKFTDKAAEKHFDDIQPQPWTDDLLKLSGIDKYLVSSGPSYYIDRLAQKYQIPPENRCRSVYKFNETTGLIESCAAVSSLNKSEFVRKNKEKYEITIGVGDSEKLDGPFLSQVTIPLLTAKSDDFISIPDFQSVILLIDRLSRIADVDKKYATSIAKLTAKSPYDRNVFIMTPYRDTAAFRETITTVRETLKSVGLRAWLASDLSLEEQLWDNAKVFMAGCRAGIAIFTPDEAKGAASGSGEVFNPNVAIEAGYMLALRKPVLILKDIGLPKLPTDFTSFLYRNFDLQHAADTVENEIRQWARTEQLGSPADAPLALPASTGN
jgi:phosphoserine phosphatase